MINFSELVVGQRVGLISTYHNREVLVGFFYVSYVDNLVVVFVSEQTDVEHIVNRDTGVKFNLDTCEYELADITYSAETIDEVLLRQEKYDLEFKINAAWRNVERLVYDRDSANISIALGQVKQLESTLSLLCI